MEAQLVILVPFIGPKIPSIHPDAFSVVVDNYIQDENSNNIKISGNSLDLTVINKSGYSMSYRYILSDLMDNGTIFSYDEGLINIGFYDIEELFTINRIRIDINSSYADCMARLS